MKLRKIIKGLSILLIGLVLLANTLGMLEWSVWYNVIKLWPLLLVSAGLSIIFRERNLNFLGPLIIFLAIIVGLGTSYSGISFEREISPETKTLSREIIAEVKEPPKLETATEAEISLDTENETTPKPEPTQESEISSEVNVQPEIEKASIKLKFDVGTLTLGESSPLLYECISQYKYKEFEPFEKYSTTDNEANILIYHSPTKKNFYNNKNDWQLKLNNQIIYNLSIETGAINADCNLLNFKIEKLYIESGASNINLVVPQYDSEIVIDTGVSNIDIAIPKNVGTIINIDSGIAIKDLDDFIRKNDMYISNNYDTAEFKAEIKIDCGVSHIDIHYM
ncbi:MAG: toast rack family protein [Candidatus Caldatribacteriota bacterium]|nr:toast rack family protein [Candidatus Caldatribacteriota bacterium]